MRIGTLKNIVLSLLVVLSLVLSGILWRGNWLRAADVGFSSANVLPPSALPDLDDAVKPSRIVLYCGKPGLEAVFGPGCTPYQEWVARLQRLHCDTFQPVTALPAGEGFTRVVFQFAVSLDHNVVSRWLPALSQSPFGLTGDQLILIQAGEGKPVSLAVHTTAGWYEAVTDLAPRIFHDTVAELVRKGPWQPVTSGSPALVPRDGVWMPMSTWHTQQISLVPLVHSFFVNPDVLTRIQAGRGSVIWTDGSRLVRYEQSRGVLSYEDPNAPQPETAARPVDLETAAAFIRNHGGSPPDVVVTSVLEGTGTGTAEVTFRDVVDGYVVLDASGLYEVDLVSDHVVRFQRPVVVRGTRQDTAKVRTIGAGELLRAIHSAGVHADVAHLNVTLGYRTETNGSLVKLVPTYVVSEGGSTLCAIDAVSGKPLKGWSGQ